MREAEDIEEEQKSMLVFYWNECWRHRANAGECLDSI